MPDTTTPRCRARHSGLWAIEPHWLNVALAAYRNGSYPLVAFDDGEDAPRQSIARITEDGIGIIQMSGPMTKGRSKFGGVDTIEARNAIRSFAANSNVSAIVLSIDSPGGTVAGTDDLANDIANAARNKPVYAQIDDEGASAAYWIAAQASAVFANPSAHVGSIGVYAVIEDTSKQAEAAGVKVHVISTGGMKGAMADGTPVTPEQIAYAQERVDAANGMFTEAIRKGRKMSSTAIAKVNDGRVYGATDSLALGLIDGIQRMDDTMAMVRKERKARADSARRSRAMAMGRMRVT